MKDKDNPYLQMEELKRIRREKEQRLREQQLRKDRAVNVDDLAARFHAVASVHLPYPTLLVEHAIKKRFGGMDKVNFDDILHLGAVIYFLENGQNPAIANMSSADLDHAIYERMSKIELHQKEEYQECLLQIFLAVKKKSNLYQIQYIQKFLQSHQAQQETGGAKH